MARVIEVMAWHPRVPGSDRHVGGILAGTAAAAPDLALASPDDWAWQDQGLCAQTDPALFFPEQGESARDAKRVCAACPVRARCLQWALETGQQHGVLGGTTERERRRIRAARDRERKELAA